MKFYETNRHRYITERQELLFQTSSGGNIFSKFYIKPSSLALLHTNANVRCERHHLLPQTPYLKTQTLRVNVTLLLFQGFHITFLGVFKPKIFYFSVFTLTEIKTDKMAWKEVCEGVHIAPRH